LLPDLVLLAWTLTTVAAWVFWVFIEPPIPDEDWFTERVGFPTMLAGISFFFLSGTLTFMEQMRTEWRAVRGKPLEAGFRREYIPARVRNEVWRRAQGRCEECGRRERLELDHIVPVSKGGSNTWRNLQLLCERCNRRKSDSI